MTKDLGRDVRELQRRSEANAAARHQALKDSLAQSGELYAELQIPDTAGPLAIVADLSERQIRISTELEAPKDGQSRGRVGWLVRQLQKAPSEITVEAKVSRLSATLSASLAQVREDPSVIIPDRTREIRAFRLTMTRELGANRSAGRGSFIDSVVLNVKSFYSEVLQRLAPWKPKAPKLRTAGPVEQEQADIPSGIAEAIESAPEPAAADDGLPA